MAPSLIKQAVKQLDPDNTRKIYLEQFKHLKEMHSDIIERALKGACLRAPTLRRERHTWRTDELSLARVQASS